MLLVPRVSAMRTEPFPRELMSLYSHAATSDSRLHNLTEPAKKKPLSSRKNRRRDPVPAEQEQCRSCQNDDSRSRAGPRPTQAGDSRSAITVRVRYGMNDKRGQSARATAGPFDLANGVLPGGLRSWQIISSHSHPVGERAYGLQARATAVGRGCRFRDVSSGGAGRSDRRDGASSGARVRTLETCSVQTTPGTRCRPPPTPHHSSPRNTM